MFALIMKILGWMGLSMVKFVFVPSLMVAKGWSFYQIVLIHSSGATFAAYIFYNFGHLIFDYINSKRKKKKKVFTKHKRRIIHVKNKYKLLGLVFIGVLISPPITALLAGRYFPSDTTLPKVVMGFFVWSIILTCISFFIADFF